MTSSVQMIEPIWTALGPDRAKALLGLHAFTGADTTGRFNGIGKQTWFKLFLDTEDVVDALRTLCSTADISDEIQLTLEQFVCTAYRPKGINISRIPELRWYMFCKYMVESLKLPPTLGALKQHILRAHVQARIWGQATVYQQALLDPLENGYHVNSNGQRRLMSHQHLMPLLRWSDVSAKETARQTVAHASQISWYAQTYVFAAHTAIMM